MDDVILVDKKKYERIKWIVKVSSIIAGGVLAFILFIIISLCLR